jgi:hypothetical protein
VLHGQLDVRVHGKPGYDNHARRAVKRVSSTSTR